MSVGRLFNCEVGMILKGLLLRSFYGVEDDGEGASILAVVVTPLLPSGRAHCTK